VSAAQDTFVADSRVRASSRRFRERRSDCGCEKSTHLSATAGGAEGFNFPTAFLVSFPFPLARRFCPGAKRFVARVKMALSESQ